MARSALAAFVLAGLLGALPLTTHGTTFVPMNEAALVHASAAVLIGTVTAIESAQTGPDGAIYTYIHVQPVRIIKGALSTDPIVLREPGGAVGDQRQVTFGAPEFWVGERALLFLSRNADGTFQTHSLAMGKFGIGTNRAGHATAVRDFGFGTSMLMPETGEIVEAPRQSARLLPMLKRLKNIARAERRPGQAAEPLNTAPDQLSMPTQVQEAYTFIGSPPARWFQPDAGQPVTYLVDSAGDQKLGLAASRAVVDAAFAAWSSVASSTLVLQDGGTTAAGPFSTCDVNRITFNDPYNEITDPSGCGGILAIGGYCAGSNTTTVNGVTFNQITVGKITFNNGWSGCAGWTQCNVGEVVTHELGHTLGFGHSADSSATMYSYAHFDGRCATLRPDDINGLNAVYPRAGTPLPTRTPTRAATSTPTRTPTATRTATRPAATSTPTRALAPTFTRTRTPTATRTPTRRATSTPTRTRTLAPTFTPTPKSASGGSSNDTCLGAINVNALPYANTVNAAAATTASTDPNPACRYGAKAKSIWYKFTPTRNLTVTASTLGSSYDTVLSVYSGSCGAMSPVTGACNDNASWFTRQSQVKFYAVANRTYYFMVSAPALNSGGTSVFRLSAW